MITHAHTYTRWFSFCLFCLLAIGGSFALQCFNQRNASYRRRNSSIHQTPRVAASFPGSRSVQITERDYFTPKSKATSEGSAFLDMMTDSILVMTRHSPYHQLPVEILMQFFFYVAQALKFCHSMILPLISDNLVRKYCSQGTRQI